MKKLVCLGLVVSSLSSLSAPAFAAEPTHEPSVADRNTARRLAVDGQKALQAGDYDKAADNFQRANELVNAPTLLLGLARARVGQGRLLEAYGIYDGIVRTGVEPNASRAFKRAHADAKTEMVELEQRLAWVTVHLRGVDPDRASITLNDQPLPAAALGVERPVNPGTLRARAEAPGYQPAEVELLLNEGERGPTVELNLVELPQAEPEPVVTPEPALSLEMDSGPSRALETAGWIGIGVGGASLIVGAVSGILAYNRHAKLVDYCRDDSTQCPVPDEDLPRARELRDDYHRYGTLANVFVGVGAALTAGGLILVLTAPDDASPSEAHVTPYVGPGSIGAVGTF